jgi:hypothetical protein
MKKVRLFFLALAALAPAFLSAQSVVDLRLLSRYSTGVFDEGATEITAFNPQLNYLYSVNANDDVIDLIDISIPNAPLLVGSIDLAAYGASANSVAFRGGYLAAAVENDDKQANGAVVFFDGNGNFVSQVEVGALPDMITFTPDGKRVLTANEGEPDDDYLNDPVGSVSVIDISGGIPSVTQANVTTIDFSSFNNQVLDESIRVFGPNATVAQDMEPEYITISSNSKTAYVTLQENNALAIISLTDNSVKLKGLGFKDHQLSGNELDASDKAAAIDIRNWPVYGMYQPDAIGFAKLNGLNYLITANEGDARDYDGFGEVERVADLLLDGDAFPDATIQEDVNLGRLNVTTTLGDSDFDGDYDQLYSFGARSFSIWTTSGNLVYDSGNRLEEITAGLYPANFNCSNSSNTLKNRSDDKGPEPEGLAIATILDRTYLFLGLERIGGVMVFDITDPLNPVFIQHALNRDFDADPEENGAGDLGPEGLLFIPSFDSPNGKNLLVVSNEISGSIAIYETDYTCGKNSVEVCLNGNTICIGASKLESALNRGATLGACSEEKLSSVAAIAQTGAVSIYPNPVSEVAEFTLAELAAGNWNLHIMDASGQVMMAENWRVNESGLFSKTVGVSPLPAGLYLYRIFNEAGEQMNGKLLISR